MTTIVIALTIIGWVLISSIVLTAACMVSARLWNTMETSEELEGGSSSSQEGEIPTMPLNSPG